VAGLGAELVGFVAVGIGLARDALGPGPQSARRSLAVWVPRTSSMSCDKAVFVDYAADARVSSDTMLLKIDRFG
jgi:hypothetical protein